MASLADFVADFNAQEPLRRTVIIDQQRQALSRARGAQTRAITHAEKWMEGASDSSEDILINELTKAMAKIDITLERLEVETLKFNSIVGVKDEVTSADKNFNDRYEAAHETLLSCSSNIKAARSILKGNAAAEAREARQHASDNPVHSSGVRPIQDLKPDDLESDASPAAFQRWIKKIHYYFEASKILHEPTTVQQGFFFACLSPEVARELESKISDFTPVFGPENTSSCESALRALWIRKYPTFVRRTHFVQCKQEPGEKSTQWLDRLRKTGMDAEVMGMSLDNWVVQIALLHSGDKRVSSKWLETSEPTFEKLKKEASAIEMARANKAATQATPSGASAKVFSASTASTVKAGSSSKGGARPKTSSSEAAKKKSSSTASTSHCYYCGSTSHTGKNNCQVFQQGTLCHNCKKPGHLSKLCRSKKASSSAPKH